MSVGKMRLGKVALGFTLAVMTSCQEPAPCTLIACGTRLTINIEAQQWEPGAYVVSITTSGRSFECRLQRGTEGAGGQAGSRGEDDVSGSMRRCEQVAGDPAGDWYTPQVYDYADITIHIFSTPRELSVKVQRDATTLLDQELTPSYVKSYPNGPDCGECLDATETLTLPAKSTSSGTED